MSDYQNLKVSIRLQQYHNFLFRSQQSHTIYIKHRCQTSPNLPSNSHLKHYITMIDNIDLEKNDDRHR